MSPTEHEKASLETFKDTTKLVVTLATGALVLVPTLVGLRRGQALEQPSLLYLAVILLLASVFFGLLVLSSLAGSQMRNDYNIMAGPTRIPGFGQWVSFFGGLCVLLVWAIQFIFAEAGLQDQSKTPKGERADVAAIELETILFDFSASSLAPGAVLRIQGRVEQPQRTRIEKIILTGHADARGSAGYNMALSRMRAEAIKSVLVQSGVPADRIEVTAAGSSLPVLSNSIAEGRQHNRRVEVKIWYRFRDPV